MKIKDVRTHVLEAALSEPFSWSLGWTGTRSALLVEVDAADGTVGWGESYGPPLPAGLEVVDHHALVRLEAEQIGRAQKTVTPYHPATGATL
jgi:L-alanine-DL-glutamate epimerase-like enolase superfamily enzyme